MMPRPALLLRTRPSEIRECTGRRGESRVRKYRHQHGVRHSDETDNRKQEQDIADSGICLNVIPPFPKLMTDVKVADDPLDLCAV